MELQSSRETTRRQLGVACNYCHLRKMRCDRRTPCSTCLKYKIQLCTYPAFRPRRSHPKLGPGFRVFDPGFIKRNDAEPSNWEVDEKTLFAALSRFDCPIDIAPTGKWDGPSSDPEVKKPITISDHAQQARTPSLDPQKVNQSISPTLETQPSRKEPSWERNTVKTDQSPTTFPEVSAWPSFPDAASTVLVMEAPFLSGPATIRSELGEFASVSLPYSQTSFTEGRDTQDSPRQEPCVIRNGILPQFQSASSASIPTGGRPCSSQDTVHSSTTADPQNADPQNESTTDTPLRINLGPEPWRMDNMSNATLSMGDPHWQCGCPRENHVAFLCDHTCWLNQECSLRLARDLSFNPDSVVAILSVLTQQHISTYTFYWSDQRRIWGSFRSSDITSRSPFWTGQGHFSLVWIYEQLVRSPDNFVRSNLERAGLMVAVMKLREFDEIHSTVFREVKLTLPSFPKDRNLTETQDSSPQSPWVVHNSALDTRDIDHGKNRSNKQKAPRTKGGQRIRTRTGCLTCRKAHLKCDDVKEICGRCSKKNLTCVYED